MSVNSARKISEQGYRRDWIKADLTCKTGLKTIAKFNKIRMEKDSNILSYEEYAELGKTLRPNSNLGLAVNKVKSFLRNEEVKSLADSDLRNLMLLNEIDEDWTIKARKGILKEARENKQFSAAIKALEGLESHLGLQNKVKIIEKQQISGSLEGINETIQQVKTERKQVTERNEEKQANDNG